MHARLRVSSLRVVVMIWSTLVKTHRDIQPSTGYTGLFKLKNIKESSEYSYNAKNINCGTKVDLHLLGPTNHKTVPLQCSSIKQRPIVAPN